MELITDFPTSRAYFLSKQPYIEAVINANTVQIWYTQSGCSLDDELLSAMICHLTRTYDGLITVDISNIEHEMISLLVHPKLSRGNDPLYPTALEDACQLVAATLCSTCALCDAYDPDFRDKLNSPFFTLDPA